MDIVTVQDSFQEVIDEVRSGTIREEKFWVSIRKEGGPQDLHYVTVTPKEFQSDIGFGGKNIFQFSGYKIQRGTKFIKLNNVSSVNRIDDTLLVGTTSGNLVVYDLLLEEQTTVPQCHFLDIVEIKVFPSKEVIMTVGLDKQIKLWSVKDWKCIRTFTCLNSTHVELIGRGRNFVNGNSNGEITLWECSTGKSIHKFSKVRNKNDPVTCIKLISSEFHHGENQLEFETNDKLVIVSYASGEMVLFDLFTKKYRYMDLEKALAAKSISVVDDVLVIGTIDGRLLLYKNEELKLEKKLNDAEVDLQIKKIDLTLNIYVYNGEETLFNLKVDLQNFSVMDTIYIAGLPEMFRVKDMVVDRQLLVGSDTGVMIF